MLSATSTGQSLEDKLYALKYFLSGQGISFVVLKATTSELVGPKKKHLNYLVNMTNEPNVSIPSLVKRLMMRARHPEWSIAFKAIITVHHLITYGNEKFIQNLASSTVNHQTFDRLCSFVDRTTTLGYNMSIFVRRYSRYINVKIQTYRSLGTDFCRTEQQSMLSDPNNNYYSNSNCSAITQVPPRMKNMPIDQLMKTIPILQNQFDVLLAFDASIYDLRNGIINTAFAMLYKDFVKLYIAYQTAIIRLLELYFSVNQLKRAREMLDIYKKFLVRMDKVSDFMRVIDAVGMDKSDMPNVSRAPNLSLKLLEKHIGDLQSTPRRIYEPIERIQSVEPPRLDYGTLDRPRRRSLRTSTRQMSVDMLSPMAVINYKKRADELNHLDKMLGLDKDKKNCDLFEQIDEDLETITTTNAKDSKVENAFLTDLANLKSSTFAKIATNNNKINQSTDFVDSSPPNVDKFTDWVRVDL